MRSMNMPSYRQQHGHQRYICGEHQHQGPSSPYQNQQTFYHCEEYQDLHPMLPGTENTIASCSPDKTDIEESTEWPPGISRFN
ncbi:60S ribosomal protein L5 [Senna tora]|uniref:60S ribosomal protein L5 n=1 Tax=Senna tora TaxID=362788 RepID=A0A834WJU9_9FABA|nr:60S ribosomal protein L5 [Senna tora]